MLTEAIGYLAAGLAVGGVVLNNRKMILCFPVWIISNGICWFLHRGAGLDSLAWRDLAFTLLAIEGWYRWHKLRKGGPG